MFSQSKRVATERNKVMLPKVKQERCQNDEPLVLFTSTPNSQGDHLASTVGQQFNCCLCEQLFGAKDQLKSHISVVHLSYLPFRCQYCQPPTCHYSATSADAQKHQAVRHPDKVPCFFTEINKEKKSELKRIQKMSLEGGFYVQQQQFQRPMNWNNVMFGPSQFPLSSLTPFPPSQITQNSMNSTSPQLMPAENTTLSLTRPSNMSALQENENALVFSAQINTGETEPSHENSQVGKNWSNSDDSEDQRAPTGTVVLTCPECQFQWSSLDQLRGHLEDVHKFSEHTKYQLLAEKAGEMAKLKNSTRPKCPKKVLKKPEMSALAETQKRANNFDQKMCNKSRRCRKCLQIVASLHYSAHVWTKHLQIKPYVCSLCTFRNANFMNMLRHTATHNGNDHVEFIDETGNYKTIFERMMNDCFPPGTKRRVYCKIAKQTANMDDNFKGQATKSKQARKTQTCSLCGTTVQTVSVMKHVWGKHMDVSMKCSKCNFKGNYYATVKQHVSNQHAGEGAKVVSMKPSLQAEALKMKELCFGSNLEDSYRK